MSTERNCRSLRVLFYGREMATEQWLSNLRAQLPDADVQAYETVSEDWQADYALVWQPPVQLFSQQKHLKGIINLGVGVDRLLKVSTLPKDVPILKLKDAGMAELILEYIHYGLLHFGRDFNRYSVLQQTKTWQPIQSKKMQDNIIGVMGTGAIGQYVAKQLSIMGYRVRSWGRTDKTIDGVDVFFGKEQLKNFAQGCDFLINILPSTPGTQGIIDKKLITNLNDNAVIINCGRGEVINNNDLIESLKSSKLKGALLDVFEKEPLSGDSPLWQLDSVLITPHIAAPTQIDESIAQIVENIHRLENNQPVNKVDRELGY